MLFSPTVADTSKKVTNKMGASIKYRRLEVIRSARKIFQPLNYRKTMAM